MALKFYGSLAKGLKLNVKVTRAIIMFGEASEEKLEMVLKKAEKL